MCIQCFLTLPKICTCRRSIHPWDTLILIVSIAFCNCNSSSFSFDVECVLTKASAHPYRTYMIFSNKEFLFYFPTCTITSLGKISYWQIKRWSQFWKRIVSWRQIMVRVGQPDISLWRWRKAVAMCCLIMSRVVWQQREWHMQNQHLDIHSRHGRYQKQQWLKGIYVYSIHPLNKKTREKANLQYFQNNLII